MNSDKEILFAINEPDLYFVAENLMKDSDINFTVVQKDNNRVYSVRSTLANSLKDTLLEEMEREIKKT
jgi:hypothetical protein